ncbi:MAG: helix-turn-helix domain-containing protein [Gammaproteobacteria bacterium]|nr:helix-turn-helix domain-containing protein [Gammaproteobacteria bacterium]
MSIENTAFRSEFGDRLKAARKIMGLNQAEFATRIGVARDTYGRYERGELSPATEVFALIARELSDITDANWLLFGGDQVHAEKIETKFFCQVLASLDDESSPLKGRNSVDFGYFAAVIYNRVMAFFLPYGLEPDQARWAEEMRIALAKLDAILSAQWVWSLEHVPHSSSISSEVMQDPKFLELIEKAKRLGDGINPDIAKLKWGPGGELERLFIDALI